MSAYLEDGTPRWVRIYDQPDTADRYTVVFTGRKTEGVYLGMSAWPFHPQGIGMHGQASRDRGQYPIDRPKYAHIGKRIAWKDLPEDCRCCAMRTYVSIHGAFRSENAGVRVGSSANGQNTFKVCT